MGVTHRRLYDGSGQDGAVFTYQIKSGLVQSLIDIAWRKVLSLFVTVQRFAVTRRDKV
jgi:hypothetical protein